MTSPSNDSTNTSRRHFIKSTATASAGAIAANLAISHNAHAAGSDKLKIGIVGIGGRGSGATKQALTADPNSEVVAVAEAFSDRLDSALSRLKKDPAVGDRINVKPEHQFVGFDAYQKVIDMVDVVVLTTPPHFRPMQLEYAIDNGVHAFVEKPVATDPTGIRRIIATCEKAKAKGLSVVSGLCWRYDLPKVETINRVMGGAIGDIVSIETTYNSGGVWDPRATRAECNSDMEYQLRNWYYYTWLSGDHICEQAIHSIDKMGWVLGDTPPLQCWATGGRAVRKDPKYGNIFDNFSVVYEYENNVKGYHHCRHWRGADGKVRDYINGTKGHCDVFGHKYTGENNWAFRTPRGTRTPNMYQVEHDVFFASIRDNKPINNGDYMWKSTLLAIMGRMAAYTGKTIKWEDALNSKLDLSPESYTFGAAPNHPLAVPGITKFI